MALDYLQARRETPGCELVTHFNNAGAALMPQVVLDTVIEHLQLEASMGGYEAATQRDAASQKVYTSIAAMLGCQNAEIALTENATRAWDMAFYSLPLGPGDRILTARAEYASNYIAFLQVARRTGATIEVIPNDESGQLSVPALREMMDRRVKLISITHVPTNGGLVNPAAEVGKVARQTGALFLLDACQSAGQMPLNVDVLGCDMLSATGRKYLRGPRGTGFLYVRRSVLDRLEPPFLDLHAARWTGPQSYEIEPGARRFENWESNFAGRLGLGAAVDYAQKWGLELIQARVVALAEELRARLAEIRGVTVRDQGQQMCGIVTFTVNNRSAEEVRLQLAQHRINVTVSGASSTLLDMEARGLQNVVRASLHYYNSPEEISRFCDVLVSLQ